MAAQRTLQQVNSMLNLAKYSESDVKEESIVVNFAKELVSSKEIKLLELSKDMVDYIKSGESLYIKGNDTSNVVLCTNTHTFDLKEAETSNSMLILPSLDSGKQVEASENRTLKTQEVLGIYHTYYEMKPIKPRLQSLRNALGNFPYKGKNTELSREPTGYSFAELKDIILASEEEILCKLQELHCVKVKGRWRLLDVGFMFGWISHLDTILRGRESRLDDISKSEVEDWMALFDTPDVNEKCMSLFMEVTGDYLRWNSKAVSQLFAMYLLPELRAFDCKDFFTAWQQSMPDGVTALEEYLDGIAIVDYDSTPSLVKYMPEFEMPEDVNERLDMLFRTRSKWTLQAITPYIQPLTDAKTNVAALLTKYARSSTVNGVKYYSSKYNTS
uniref:Sister chromatid cohesion protein DCC1 n=1 Tax=Moina brachiata TaxID=675436 RepID=A0A4Y7NJ07_9CRUS|nr:EOG090X09TV [Moina brachiata]SVE93132.1 EOG090X09TV [Moina brachiata]